MEKVINPIKDNIICLTKNELAIYVAPPKYYVGISALSGPEINIKNFISTASYGNSKYVKALFEEPIITSVFWEYIVEYRNQFLSKDFMKNNINYLKKFYNKLIYDIHSDNFNNQLQTDPNVINLFIEYDFCNQVLAAGKYIPNNFDAEVLKLLSDKEILNLIHNHIYILDEKLEMSSLQQSVQMDVMNHICTHAILEYWKWQKWI
jgi:hypothetical protein